MADTDNYPGPAARPGGKGAGGTIALVAAVLLVVFGVWWFKTSSSTSGPSAVHKGLPRLVDLGGENCNECKKMAPILAELKDQYVGRMDVQFIDVWKDPKAGEEYGIRIIPTTTRRARSAFGTKASYRKRISCASGRSWAWS